MLFTEKGVGSVEGEIKAGEAREVGGMGGWETLERKLLHDNAPGDGKYVMCC